MVCFDKEFPCVFFKWWQIKKHLDGIQLYKHTRIAGRKADKQTDNENPDLIGMNVDHDQASRQLQYLRLLTQLAEPVP